MSRSYSKIFLGGVGIKIPKRKEMATHCIYELHQTRLCSSNNQTELATSFFPVSFFFFIPTLATPPITADKFDRVHVTGHSHFSHPIIHLHSSSPKPHPFPLIETEWTMHHLRRTRILKSHSA